MGKLDKQAEKLILEGKSRQEIFDQLYSESKNDLESLAKIVRNQIPLNLRDKIPGYFNLLNVVLVSTILFYLIVFTLFLINENSDSIIIFIIPLMLIFSILSFIHVRKHRGKQIHSLSFSFIFPVYVFIKNEMYNSVDFENPWFVLTVIWIIITAMSSVLSYIIYNKICPQPTPILDKNSEVINYKFVEPDLIESSEDLLDDKF